MRPSNDHREWFDRFNEEIKRQATDPQAWHHIAVWRDVRELYEDGYNAQQAATKYMRWYHLI